MPTTSQIEQRIRNLDAEISLLVQEQAKCRLERKVISSRLARLTAIRCWHRFVLWFRSPVARFDLWPIAVMVCGPAIVGAAFFVIFHLLTHSIFSASIAGGAGVLGGALILSILLFLHRSEALEDAVARIDRELPTRRGEYGLLRLRDDEIAQRLSSRRNERQQLVSSVQYQREQLLQEKWKAMRGVQWEQYLARVFRALGYLVETTKTTGDQGVDLIVVRGQVRIAVQAKGYANSVGNAAVQQAVAGMRMYNCNGCAVVTNNRFTQAAVQLAAANGCLLISEDDFEDFVLGKLGQRTGATVYNAP